MFLHLAEAKFNGVLNEIQCVSFSNFSSRGRTEQFDERHRLWRPGESLNIVRWQKAGYGWEERGEIKDRKHRKTLDGDSTSILPMREQIYLI
jgi:hypothetical protein